MSILIIGSQGSQGLRYQSILDYVGEDYLLRDVGFNEISDDGLHLGAVDGIIVATPTNTHTKIIRELLKFRIPILCEKPICKDMEELEILFEEIEKTKTPFSMVHQYKRLVTPTLDDAVSTYNYFKHGNDGLIWDCLQIIGLANGVVDLSDESPIWKCQINGQKLDIAQMDGAYLEEIELWLNGESYSLEYLFRIHQKTADFSKTKELSQ